MSWSRTPSGVLPGLSVRVLCLWCPPAASGAGAVSIARNARASPSTGSTDRAFAGEVALHGRVALSGPPRLWRIATSVTLLMADGA